MRSEGNCPSGSGEGGGGNHFSVLGGWFGGPVAVVQFASVYPGYGEHVVSSEMVTVGWNIFVILGKISELPPLSVWLNAI